MTPPAILSSRWLVNVNVVLTVEDIVITSKETILSYTRAYRNKEYTSPITISFLYEDYNFYHCFCISSFKLSIPNFNFKFNYERGSLDSWHDKYKYKTKWFSYNFYTIKDRIIFICFVGRDWLYPNFFFLSVVDVFCKKSFI